MMDDLLTEIGRKYSGIGCSLSEVSQLESRLGARLPNDYKQFLFAYGEHANEFMRGEDIFLDRLYPLKEWLQEVLDDDGSPFKLHDHDVVFHGHQGYYYHFFNSQDSNKVYHYMEGDQVPSFKCQTFTEFLKIKLQEYSGVE